MDQADFIVVGAGAGGCAVAARLAAARPDLTVVLLETGPARRSMLSRIPLGIAALVGLKGQHNTSRLTSKPRTTDHGPAAGAHGAAIACR